MKVTDVRLVVFNREVKVSDADMMILGQSLQPLFAENLCIRVLTDEGVEGNAFALGLGGSMGVAHHIAHNMKPALVGRNPLEVEAIWQDFWSWDRLWFSPQLALGPVEVALWDIVGKVAGLPIYQLLGAYRHKVKAYASSMTKPSPEAYAEEALKYRGKGYTAYKLHCWGEPRRDMEACRAVRKAMGDDYVLMMDAVGAYSQQDALRVGRELEELNFHWYEEPLRDFDIHGYKMLCDALEIPIAGVEVVPGGLFMVSEYIVQRAVDIVRADVTFKGGIGPTKKTAALAEAFGLQCEVHSNVNPVLDAANLHVNCSIKNGEYFEQLVPEELFFFGVHEGIRIDREGYAHVPQGQGLGLEIDWDYINRFKVAEL
ncbi:MAG: enolase C-terminal domain-like protein [Chloroflexota bacterium]